MAILEQERHIELVSGAQERFVITSSVTSATIPTQLPHLNVFVLVTVDPADAKDDTFARVARISDLSLIPIGRDNAVAATGEYLAASVTLGYSTLTEAQLAATAMKDRVEKLVKDWISFAAGFNAPSPTPATYTIPTGASTQVEALIEAYKVAKQDRYLKDLAKAEADAAHTRAQTDFSYKQGLVASVGSLAASGLVTNTDLASAKAAYDVLTGAGNVYYAASVCAGAGDRTTFQAALNVAANQSTVMFGDTVDAAALYTALLAFKTSVEGTRDTANTTLTAATAARTTATQEQTDAITLETTTLAAVIAVCPDFDSTSIPYVDG